MSAKLEDWINPDHLSPAAIAAAAVRFRACPFETVCFDDFLQPRHLERLRRLFEVEGTFEPFLQVRDPSVPTTLREVCPEEFATTPESVRFESEFLLARVRPECLMAPGYLTHVRLLHFVQQPPLRRFLEAVTGIDPVMVDGMQVRITRAGGYVRRHQDWNPRRRLALVYYLSRDWVPADGGRLLQFAPTGETRAVAPVPNRLVVFRLAETQDHEVELLAPGAGPRFAYTFWWGEPAPPPEG